MHICFLKRKSPPGNPWIDDWKNNHVGFPCKRMHVSEIENQHSTVPMCAHIKKTFYLEHFELPCDPSKPFLMQTQQKTQSVKLRKTFSSPSHYLICYGGYTVNFHLCLSGALLVLFSLILWSVILWYNQILCCFHQKHCSMKILTQMFMLQTVLLQYMIWFVFASQPSSLSYWTKHDS